MSMWAAVLIGVLNPCTLLTVAVALCPKRWFVAGSDADRQVLASYRKYDAALHGE